MTYLNMKAAEKAVLIAFEDKRVEFWLDYNPETFYGEFHDNREIKLSALTGMTAEELSKSQADQILRKISDFMKKTAACRYAIEIERWIARRDSMDR